jgi:pilus assembly protein CpaB
MAERRYTTIFGAALVTAGLATFGIYRVLQASKAQNRVITRPVVIAFKDVAEGKAIDRASVTVAEWPINTIPAGAFASVDSVVNRVTRIDVFRGEVIVPGRLAPDGTTPGLQVKITPGKRAASVRIDDVSGLNGMIQANSRVDVLVATRDNKTQKDVAKTFMSNMRVLAVGTITSQSADNRPIQAATVSLEVTPTEAERLMIAQAQGRIQLTLRGYGDPDSIRTNGANSDDVLAQLRAAPVANIDPAPARRASAPGGSGRRQQAPVQQAAPPPQVVAPQAPSTGEVATKQHTLDTNVVQIFKADKQDTRKFVSQKDSLKADSLKKNKPPL